MPLFFETILPLGLDISDLKLRLIQLKKSRKNIKIASFSEVNMPSGIISDGLVLQPARLIELINQLKQGVIGSHLLKNNKVIVGLPEKQSISKLTPIANTDPETIMKEVAKHVPFQLNEIYYDYQILNNFLNNCPALYFAASRKILIENYLKVLRAAGLEPEVFEIETEATARALLLPTDKSAYFIIDIGLARSTISIVYQRLTAFSISFPTIIYDKKAYISELINHLNRIIEFYTEHLSNYFKITAIITCGTGAHIKNLNEEIELKFNIKTLAGNPWQNIKNYNDHLIKKMKFPNAYATAVGLALRPALNKNMLNILPPELKQENKLKNIYFNLKKTAVMILIILFIPTILLISNYLLFRNIIAGLEIESPISAVQKQKVDDTRNNISSFNALLQKSIKIQEAHINPVILIHHFSTLIPQNTMVQTLNISLTDSKINFTGYANSRDDLIQLQNNLSSDTVFTDFFYPINPLSEKENIYFDFTGKINLSSETLKKYVDEE